MTLLKQPWKIDRLFYGWVIVLISCIGMTLTYGIRNSFSVFFPSILKEFGWSRGNTAIMLSLSILMYGFVAPMAGTLADRWKPRKVMTIGIVLLGLGTASCAFASRLWHFYLFFGVLVPIGMALSGWPLLGPALANWFVRRRGLAVGLGQIGMGFSFTYGMFAEFTISRLGWRSAYLVLAGTLVILMVPIYLLFFRYRPEDKGLAPYGSGNAPAPQKMPTETPVPHDSDFLFWNLRRAIKTYQLWLLLLSMFFYWGIGSYLVLAHQIKFVEEAGYSSLFATSVFALFGIFIIVGELSAALSDWLGREATVVIATVMAVGALLALLFVRDTSRDWLLYIYACCFGFSAGLYTPTIFSGTADIFHGRHFGAIAGLLLTGMGAGGAFGPWLGGFIYDLSGSYVSAFVLCIICFFLACISFIIAAPRNAAKIQRRAKTAASLTN